MTEARDFARPVRVHAGGVRPPGARHARRHPWPSTVRYAAPGRVNLIGEHTDYNQGFALPIGLPRRTVVTFSPDRSDAIAVRSDRADGVVRIPLSTEPGELTGWAGYVAGVIWALRHIGHRVPGGTMSITSDVPIGSGLSSSAALTCAVLGSNCADRKSVV